MNNQDVYKLYQNNKIDVFINSSENEGVPVSIMEAMSCYIPIIAPNVGGISELIQDNYNGKLLSEKCTISELSTAITQISFFKSSEVRDNARKQYEDKYNASKNYNEFIDVLTTIE